MEFITNFAPLLNGSIGAVLKFAGAIILLIILFRVVKCIVKRLSFIRCPLSRACAYVANKLGLGCGSCEGGSCDMTGCPVVEVLKKVVTVVLTVLAYSVVSDFLGLEALSVILNGAVEFLGDVIGYIINVVVAFLALVPLTIAGRTVLVGIDQSFDEFVGFFNNKVRTLFNTAKDTAETVADTVVGE